MPEFNVKFFNKVSGWLHSELAVVAATEEAAVKAAARAFDEVHAYAQAWYDNETGVNHPEKGTPGHNASLYNLAVAPIVEVGAGLLAEALHKLYPPVSVGGVQQEPVPADSVQKQPEE